jgi:hypothetical protein
MTYVFYILLNSYLVTYHHSLYYSIHMATVGPETPSSVNLGATFAVDASTRSMADEQYAIAPPFELSVIDGKPNAVASYHGASIVLPELPQATSVVQEISAGMLKRP